MAATITSAVVPAAGIGRRMMPASAAVPKELFPVGCQPTIRWSALEIAEAGIEQLIVVSSPLKPAMDAYLAGPLSVELPQLHIEVVHQPVARGLGDAVRLASSLLGGEPFAVLLPDEILLGGARLLRAMLADYERSGQSSVSLLEVERSDIGSYGCAAVTPRGGSEDQWIITSCIEKPEPASAPSNLAISGRYVLGPDVLEPLKEVVPDHRGEVQLTDALAIAASSTHLAGFRVLEEDGRVDVGNWAGWLDATGRLGASLGLAPQGAAPLSTGR